MATAQRYGGFRPFAGDDSGDNRRLDKTAAIIYKGDIVYADSDGKVLSITDASGSTLAQAKAVVGVALEYAAAAASDVLVHLIKKDELFIAQCDSALSTTSRWLNADISEAAGSGTLSGHCIDGSTAATTTLLPLKIIDFVEGIDSSLGTAYQYALVRFNVYVGDVAGTTGI